MPIVKLSDIVDAIQMQSEEMFHYFNLPIPCGLAAGKKGKFENRRFSR